MNYNKDFYYFLSEEIKWELKHCAINYKELAKRMCISEKTVVRTLNQHQHMNLERLQTICNILNIPISELFKRVENKIGRVAYFNDEQDALFTQNSELYELFKLLHKTTNMKMLCDIQVCEKSVMYLRLRELEKVKAIVLGLNNTIKLIVPYYAVFKPDSLYAKKITKKTMQNLLNNCLEEKDNSTIKVINVELTIEEFDVFLTIVKEQLLHLMRCQHRREMSDTSSYTIALLAHNCSEK